MDRSRILAVALTTLAAAPGVEALRALLALASVQEPSWYWVLFAVGGSLSGLAMLTAAFLTLRTWVFPWVAGGAATALVGHYIVIELPWPAIALLATSLVHIGVALVLRPWGAWVLVAGAVAAVGAYLRWSYPVAGNALLLVGALGLAAAVVMARSGPGPTGDAKP